MTHEYSPDGLPYLGFSAGASIAPDQALIGGWMIGDVAVCAEDNAEDNAEDIAEDLDEVTVGTGSVWRVSPGDDGVVVSTVGAE